MAQDERADLVQLLAELRPEQWNDATLCADWQVRDVAAHVISYDELTAFEHVKTLVVDARFDVDRFNAICLRPYERLSTPQLRNAMIDHVQPRGYMAVFSGIGLLDAMIHTQDIRRPLGRPRSIPVERLCSALQCCLYVPLLRAAWRSRGLRLIATDADWTYGRGLEVRAPGEALLMSLAGRRDAFDQLTGPGVAELLRRCTAAPPEQRRGPLR